MMHETYIENWAQSSGFWSWIAQHHPHLPPGFRLHPTDEELVVHYLKRKAASAPLPVAIIADVDLYKFDPWELPSMLYFITPHFIFPSIFQISRF